MTHTAIQAVKATVNGYCEMHSTSPKECGAAQEAGKYAIISLGIIGVANALARGHK